MYLFVVKQVNSNSCKVPTSSRVHRTSPFYNIHICMMIHHTSEHTYNIHICMLNMYDEIIHLDEIYLDTESKSKYH